MSVSLFIPVRKGSERVPDKNNRKFGSFDNGLLEYKLTQLLDQKIFDEIVVSSNDEKSLALAEKYKGKIPGLKLDKRPEALSQSDTPLEELIKYVPDVALSEFILWTHVTSPFCLLEDYRIAVNSLNVNEEFDSVISVEVFQEYFWDKHRGKVLNTSDSNKWPRTQDLEKQFMINNAIFLAKREDFSKGNRIGANPYLLEMGKIRSTDVDTLEDFEIAEIFYDRFFK